MAKATGTLNKLNSQIGIAALVTVPLMLIDATLPHAFGFLEVGILPYLVLVASFAMFSGVVAALSTALAVLGWLMWLGPLVITQLGLAATVRPLIELSVGVRYGSFILILITFWGAMRFARLRLELQQSRTRTAEAIQQHDLAAAQAKALEKSLRHLYNRIASESSSITVLYEQLESLYSFDQNTVLQAALAAARLLTGATSCAIYQFREQSLQLYRRAVWPPRDQDRYQPQVDVATSILGSVVRSGQLFSIRHLVSDPELRKIDDRRTILCAPIIVRDQMWGVLTIGAMPFIRYNEYSEKALQVTAALAAPALEQALPTLMSADPARAEGLPVEDSAVAATVLAHERLRPELVATVTSAQEDGYQVALLLLALNVVPWLEDGGELARTIGLAIAQGTPRNVTVYERADNCQLAIVAVSADHHTAAHLALRMLELVGQRAWTVQDETVLPQPLVGFSTTTQCGYNVDRLLQHAELMLRLQNPEAPIDLA